MPRPDSRHHKCLLGRSDIQRIGLRYINRIDPGGKPETGLLTVLPDIRESFGSDASPFYQRYELNASDREGTLIFQTGKA